MMWTPLLLADPSPSLRLLVLRELLGRPETDDEIGELKELQGKDPRVVKILALQRKNGSWPGGAGGGRGSVRMTAQALMGLGYMGLEPGHSAVKKGAEFLFARQESDGSWLPKGRDEGDETDEIDRRAEAKIPLQTALPLLGLAWAGYGTDPRSEKAYEWLLGQSLPQGGWPASWRDGTPAFAAGYRRLAHSTHGCRTNTTAAVSTLALHPRRCTSEAARRGMDLLLATEHQQSHTLGFEVARIIGAEPVRGSLTYFKRYDVAQMLDLSWRIGANMSDQRIADHVAFIRKLQGTYGLWEYSRHPEVSRWVTFDLLRSLSRLDTETDWISLEPRTPFQPYPKRPRRF